MLNKILSFQCKPLIAQGADKDTQNKDIGATALMEASYEGHLDIVKDLVEQGADKEKQDNIGDTALMKTY